MNGVYLTVDEEGRVHLAPADIDAIAQRVIELLKEQNRVLCRGKI
jgi:hypothetical protein